MPADHVTCTWCGEEMYVHIGEEICPNCKKEGCLAWVDNEEQEVEVDYYGIVNK